jgi:hypothetical protein
MKTHLPSPGTARTKTTLLAGLIALLPFAGQTAIISVNWSNGTDLASTDVAGVVAADNWNNLSASGYNIGIFTDDSGATVSDFAIGSGAGLPSTLPGNGPFQFIGSPSGSDEIMLSSGIYNNSWGAGYQTAMLLFDIPYAEYDLYVYAANNATGRSANYRVGSDVQTYADTQAIGTVFTQGENYVRFSGLTSANLTLEADPTGTSNQIVVSGIQIVAVPEPSSLMLIGLALGAVLLHRKRRS